MAGRGPMFRSPKSAAGGARAGEAEEGGTQSRAGEDRGPDDRQDFLGRSLVRQPRTLQRLRQPPAARPHLCPQRFRRPPADRQARSRPWSAAPTSTRSRSTSPRSPGRAGRPSAATAPGTIDSLVELLQGRLAKGVMERMCPPGRRPVPLAERDQDVLQLPGLAGMCKHIAAVLYGVGARLDQRPEHLFMLRGVDQSELIAGIGESFPLPASPASAKVLDDGDVAALFEIDMGEPAAPVAAPVPEPARRSKAGKRREPAPRPGGLPGSPEPRSAAPARSRVGRAPRRSAIVTDDRRAQKAPTKR